MILVMNSTSLETIDYSTMNITSTDELFEATNTSIADDYRKTMNIKIGGEYAMNAFRLRGGFASIGAPSVDGNSYSRQIISGGIGMQESNWSFDVGLSKDLPEDSYNPYTVTGVDPNNVSSEFNQTRLMVTLSTKF